MIKFRVNDQKIEVIIDTNLPTDKSLMSLYWQCESGITAWALRNWLEARLEQAVEVVSKASYEDGWKDAKAKRAKSKYFRRFL